VIQAVNGYGIREAGSEKARRFQPEMCCIIREKSVKGRGGTLSGLNGAI